MINGGWSKQERESWAYFREKKVIPHFISALISLIPPCHHSGKNSKISVRFRAARVTDQHQPTKEEGGDGL